jgi:hypothetical protein
MMGEAGEKEEIEGTGVPSPLSISWLPLLAPSRQGSLLVLGPCP